MFFSLKKLIGTLAPVLLLMMVLGASFRMIQTENASARGLQPLPTPVAPQAVVIEAKSKAPDALVPRQVSRSLQSSDLQRDPPPQPEPHPDLRPLPPTQQAEAAPQPSSPVPEPSSSPVPEKSPEKSPEKNKGKVWAEISDAISGLNELVGAEMFIDVKREDNGQMTIRLDNEIWNRVRYQTRVDLKTDISNLWHLYVTEYDDHSKSIVYFLDNSDERVIDIFSRAN